jgi:hypothetical protein
MSTPPDSTLYLKNGSRTRGTAIGAEPHFNDTYTARVLAHPADHDAALSAIEALVNDGAMGSEDHPGYELVGLMFDAIHHYEAIHLPF